MPCGSLVCDSAANSHHAILDKKSFSEWRQTTCDIIQPKSFIVFPTFCVYVVVASCPTTLP